MGDSPSLSITPAELSFQPPYTKVIQTKMVLHNSDATSAIAYKVRTTAPKRYMVRPGTGTVPPLKSAEITVFLNLLKDPPKNNDVSTLKDKFQVQEVNVDLPQGATPEEITEIVKTTFASNKDSIRSQKLKTTFVAEATPSRVDDDASRLSKNLAKATEEVEHWKRKYQLAVSSAQTAPAATASSPFTYLIAAFIIGFLFGVFLW
eukprot:TRINITY_DN1181_c0_g1_i2.p1 TRINITY_DN1181_c0_g1~~TRINITY_DN1181_c0_g1_i2.p1  ORF type:complete len:205 (-),score=36.22 TRINITY_DN1181_c0_g1_i2:365-979(-)